MTVVNPAQLATAVSKVMQAVESRNPNPILGFIRLTAAAGEMELVGTDLDIRMTTSVPAEGDFAPLCIDGQRLAAALARIKDRGEATFRILDRDVVELKSGRSTFNLPTLPADGFPDMVEVDTPVAFSVDGAAFRSVMSALQPAISHEETRYYLNGISMQPASLQDEADKHHLVFIATDGHKAYARHIAVNDRPKEMRAIIIPAKTTQLINKLFDKLEQLDIEVGASKIRISGGNVEMLSKLVDGIYPDWRRVMPATPACFSYKTAAIIAAVETASAVTATNTKLGKAAKLTFGEVETEFYTRDPSNPAFSGHDVCSHTELRPADTDHIGVNAKYLAEMLSVLDAETAEIAVTTVNNPMVITGAGMTDRRVVIMPMRV